MGSIFTNSTPIYRAGAAAYSALRFVEAYGLWRERAWAEVLAALSGSIYVPFEVIDLLSGPGWLGFALLGLNVVIVVVMVRALIRRRALSGTVAR